MLFTGYYILIIEQMNTLRKEIDFYYDEHNNLVLTARYHVERGFCCGHGCRHCPYKYENVPEPRRTLLLKAAKHEYKKESSANS